jgi:integrase/recombinase XerD
MKLSKAVEGFGIAFLADGKSSETLKTHRLFLSRLVTRIGDKPVEDVTTDDLRGFMKWLVTDYQPARSSGDTSPLRSGSLARCWAALRSFWRWAAVEFSLKSNPALALKMPKVDTRAVIPFTEDEVRKLLESAKRDRCNTARDQAIIVTLLDTGLRVSELARLKLRDVDLEAGQVEVRSVGSGTKSKSRVVILGKSARRYLWRYLAIRDDADDKDGPLFITQSGRPMTRSSIRLALTRLGKRAGVKCNPHKFRHSFAITFLRNGGNIFVLQAILGHADLQMVKHYAAIAQIDIVEAHRRASPANGWHL